MKELNIISLGMGVQSTAMYLMSSTGELPRADYAIFSDTGGEKKKTLEYLKWLQAWAKKNNGIPIIVRRDRNLYTDVVKKKQTRGNVPAFTSVGGGAGMLKRQCTGEYKIHVVDQAIREIYGLKPRQRYKRTIVWKGISLEEVGRASIPHEKWKVFFYPFLNLKVEKGGIITKTDCDKMYRANILEWYKKRGYPIPVKSSCVFCPYMNDVERAAMKAENGSDWKKAVRFDKSIRNSTEQGITQPIFIHRSLVPIDMVDFSLEENQVSIDFGECSGNCHV